MEDGDGLPDTAHPTGERADIGMRAMLVSIGLLGLLALVAGLSRRELAGAHTRP